METTEIKIPKFRSTNRLVSWMSKTGRWKVDRLPRDRENVFFTTKKEDARSVAHNVFCYAGMVGKLEDEFENLLLCNHSALLSYCRLLHYKGESVNERLIDELKDDSVSLFMWAECTNKRLPKHLEDSITDPRVCYRYAVEVLRGRLPSHLEHCFFKDATYAAKYAFDVIRGFSPVRLPDELHSFMVMKSYEEPDNEKIKAYMLSAESDPNVVGNSDETV